MEAMHLQCFPPTLRECALFRKRVHLDRAWTLAIFCVAIFLLPSLEKLHSKCKERFNVNKCFELCEAFKPNLSCKMSRNVRAGLLIHTLEFEVFPYGCMWKPCVCNVSRPLYVSVRYLKNSSFWLAEYALAILYGF